MVFSSQSNLLFFKRRFPNLLKLFSSSPSPSPPSPPPKPTSLSARMSFVFDQIDAIKSEQGDKDQTLQRIRAWRESKQQNALNKDAQNAPIPQKAETVMVVEKEGRGVEKGENGEVGRGKDLVLTHPWPEWMELIERLVKQNYFDSRRSNEEGMLENAGFRLDEMMEEGKGDGEGEEGLTRNDFNDWNTVETAVLNFGRDRFDILRFACCVGDWLML